MALASHPLFTYQQPVPNSNSPLGADLTIGSTWLERQRDALKRM